MNWASLPTSWWQEADRQVGMWPLRDKGRRCDLHLHKGQGHGFFNFKNEEYFTKTVVEADRFLTSLEYLQGKPTLQNRAGCRRLANSRA